MYNSKSPSENDNSRPSSITRSSRQDFSPELEILPSESVDEYIELNEEVLDVEDLSDEEVEDVEVGNVGGKQVNVDGSVEGGVSVRSSTESGNSEERRKATSSVESTESELDIKIRKGLEKVKKLDEILNETIEKEREAKKSRRAIEKEFQSQVSNLIEEKGADKVCGSQQLLYLCASSDRAEDMKGTDDIEPIFTTQIDAEYYDDAETNGDISCNDDNQSVKSSEAGGKSEKTKRKGKDFVKRNIQLAQHANDMIPLTVDERKRLDELLADDSDLLMVENPFSTPAITIGAYQHSNDEMKTLESIDAKLKELLPEDEFMLSIGSGTTLDASSISGSQTNRSDTTRDSEIVIPEVKCGEHVLQEGHDDRAVALRLQNIEERLKELQHRDEAEETGERSLIDPDLLRKLLDVDSRLTSDSVSICESARSRSEFYNDNESSIFGNDMASEYGGGVAEYHCNGIDTNVDIVVN